MSWQLFSKTRRSRSSPPSAQRFRFRPNLDALEDRTLLTVHVFSIAPTASSLTLSGTFATPIGSGTIQEQGPGSLTTKYEGTITADVARFGSAITFLGGSTSVAADISGNWQPNVGGGSGSAPANYGGKASVSFVSGLAAVRNLLVSGSSDALPMTPTGANFTYSFPSKQTLSITKGDLDYSYSAGIFGSGHGTVSAAGQSAQNTASDGLAQGDGISQITLVVPVHVQYMQTFSTPIGNVTVTLIIQGTITAYSTFPSPSGDLSNPIDASVVTAIQQSSGAALGTEVAPVSLPATDGTLTTFTDGLASKQDLLPDDMGIHAFVTNHTAPVDTLAAMDGLAVELFR